MRGAAATYYRSMDVQLSVVTAYERAAGAMHSEGKARRGDVDSEELQDHWKAQMDVVQQARKVAGM